MGIQGLTALLKRFVPQAIRQIKLDEFVQKKVAIDANLFLYKFDYTCDNIFQGFFLQMYHLRRRCIEPIYVFDGKPPPEKQRLIQQRKENQLKLENKLSCLEMQLGQLNQMASMSTVSGQDITNQKTDVIQKIKSLQKRRFLITSEDIKDLKRMMLLMNVCYYEASGEADVLCVQLEKKGIVDACMTEDMDFLTHGCRVLLRDYYNKGNKVNVFCLETILAGLELTHDQFVDLCILCGCDYTSKIKGVGMVGALKLIRKYKTIEDILVHECGEGCRYDVSSEFDFKKARDLFHASNEVMPFHRYDCAEVDLDELNMFLKERLTLTEKQVQYKLKKLFGV